MRILVFVTHPVQYHVPLWRALAGQENLSVKVFYFSDHSVRGGLDKGFGVNVSWDIDLLSGYDHDFLCRDANLERPQSVRIQDVDRLLEQERPDWIFVAGYTMRFEQQLVRAAAKHGARVLMRAEFSDLSFGKRGLLKTAARWAYLRWFYSHVTAFCYPGENGRRHLQRHGVAANQMHFSPYCVDDALIARSRENTDCGEARRALGLSDDTFALVLSGKLIARKNPGELLSALEKLGPLREQIALIALGDGELRESFTGRATALLGARFIWPGFVNQSQLGRFFQAGDALVMPSLHETWGLVVNEAMHYGMPAIVSDQVGCHHDLVVPGETGYVYPSGNVDELARRIAQLTVDRGLAKRMGQLAERRVATYTVQTAAQGLLEALRS